MVIVLGTARAPLQVTLTEIATEMDGRMAIITEIVWVSNKQSSINHQQCIQYIEEVSSEYRPNVTSLSSKATI